MGLAATTRSVSNFQQRVMILWVLPFFNRLDSEGSAKCDEPTDGGSMLVSWETVAAATSLRGGSMKNSGGSSTCSLGVLEADAK
jgi:hypothetical protein